MENKDLFKKKGFIYVPKLKLEFSFEKAYFGKSWHTSQELLEKGNYKMPTIPQFLEFLNYLKTSKNKEHLGLFEEIVGLRPPKRSEWLNADVKVKEKRLYLNLEILDKDTLMKKSIISLDDFLDSAHTEQGLPTKNVKRRKKNGCLYYWPPKENNLSVGGFAAMDEGRCLGFWGPGFLYSSNGVRAVREKI